jgi:hypothetical protein
MAEGLNCKKLQPDYVFHTSIFFVSLRTPLDAHETYSNWTRQLAVYVCRAVLYRVVTPEPLCGVAHCPIKANSRTAHQQLRLCVIVIDMESVSSCCGLRSVLVRCITVAHVRHRLNVSCPRDVFCMACLTAESVWYVGSTQKSVLPFWYCNAQLCAQMVEENSSSVKMKRPKEGPNT